MDLKFQITDHVTYAELIRSSWAKRSNVSNAPDFNKLGMTEEEFFSRAKKFLENTYEKIRVGLNIPIWIESCYRNYAVNTGIKGSYSSQHMKMEAIDLDADVYAPVLGDKAITNRELFEWCKKNLDFDQLLWEGGEYGWVHISCKADLSKNRHYVGQIPHPKPAQ